MRVKPSRSSVRDVALSTDSKGAYRIGHRSLFRSLQHTWLRVSRTFVHPVTGPGTKDAWSHSDARGNESGDVQRCRNRDATNGYGGRWSAGRRGKVQRNAA